MEISRDSLLRIVKAARIAGKQAETMKGLLVEKSWTWADEIAGQLYDALFLLSGEKLQPNQDFGNSRTAMLLGSDMSDGDVTDWYLMMDRLNRRIESMEQPKPNVISKEQLQQMHENNSGGYLSPEG